MLCGHFHVHDEFSPLDGTGNANQLSTEAARKGQTHLGRTNHGRLGGILEHIDACRHPEKYDDPHNESQKRSKDERLHPVLGIEAYWRPDVNMELIKGEQYGENPHNWAQHLCLHARTLTGWKTLMRLSSKSWVRREKGGGYYGKPCMDMAMLREDHEDIMVSTACVQSPLSHLILAGEESDARKWCKEIIEIVGSNNFFLEIMPHNFDNQREVNIGVINIGNELGQPFLHASDVHIPYADWEDTHEIVRMASYRTTVSKQEKKKDEGEEVYTEKIDTVFLGSDKEIAKQYKKYQPDLPKSVVREALDNTGVLANRVKMFTIGKTTKLPKTDVDDPEQTIRDWCEQGLKRIDRADDDKYRKRYEYEFESLKGKGVLDFFVMVGDMVKWAKSRDPLPGTKLKKPRPIRVGLGRGSAAGCLISYLIEVTAVDPIAWGLLFERFLNPDRVGLPDIDLDFETDIKILLGMDGRQLVKEYLRRKYGHDHVADVIAYQTFAPRAVIKAVSGTQELGYKEVNKVTDSIGDTERNLSKIAKTNPLVAKFQENHPEVWKHCLRLEDEILRDTKHAGGVVITPKPVTDYMPTQLGTDEETIVTAWSDRAEFPIVSDYGFVKWDVLGVKSLTKQQLAVDLIKDHYDEEVEPNDLAVLRDPYDIPGRVLDGFTKGLTLGIFQFGGAGITKLLRAIKPDNAIDIAVANALWRPGPIKIAYEYAERKHGQIPEDQWYWHDAVEPVLKETLGLIAFQEQVMEITKVLGGFTGGEADSMRKAMSKMYRLPGEEAQKFMEGYRDKFFQGCRDNSLKDRVIEVIWAGTLEWGEYGFNKSHAGSYGLQACQDMWLKIDYPLAMYSAILTITKKAKRDDQIDFVKGVLREARVLDVQVRPPDVNKSGQGWTIDVDKIRFGISSIKDMGSAGFDPIADERRKKEFSRYDDFLKRMPSNYSVGKNEALAKAGAFDSIDDRELLLSPVRAIGDDRKRFKVVMTCGCKKQKTVKLNKETVEEAMDSIICKKHFADGAEVSDYEEIDPYITYARALKEFGEKKFEIERQPTRQEIMDMELEALSFPYSLSKTQSEYDDFLKERIFSEEELEELPSKPARRKNMHGTWCVCDDCKAAECVVGGEVTHVKEIVTKNDDKMAFLDVTFGTNKYNVTVFNWLWLEVRELVRQPVIFLIAGHHQIRSGEHNIMANEIADAIQVAEADGWKPKEENGDSEKKRLRDRGKRSNKISKHGRGRTTNRRRTDRTKLVVRK